MSYVKVQRVQDKSAKPLPLFQEIEKQFDDIRHRAFELFESRGRQFGHALEDWLKAEHEVAGWPAAELKEIDSKFNLSVTLPGYEAKDVQVTATPTEIIVHANVEPPKEGPAVKRVWTEFQPNEVCRRFELPEDIDVNQTSASLDKGMLHVTAAKLPKTAAKPIEVHAA